jgi:hypothetical protein
MGALPTGALLSKSTRWGLLDLKRAGSAGLGLAILGADECTLGSGRNGLTPCFCGLGWKLLGALVDGCGTPLDVEAFGALLGCMGFTVEG